MGLEDVRAMANRLLAESREMLSVNHQLKENLQASRLNMEALQADLEDVRHQSILDPLTMIHNRKYLDEALRVSLNFLKWSMSIISSDRGEDWSRACSTA